jgi:hypothetical protein
MRAAGERPLYQVRDTADQFVFRMISPIGGAAGIARLERRGTDWMFVQKNIHESGRRPRLSFADSAIISLAQVDDLISIITKSEYWTQPPQRCRVGLDGFSVMLEARVGSKYVGLDCWLPDARGAPAVVATMRAFNQISDRLFGKAR